jgi:hypothetical protein
MSHQIENHARDLASMLDRGQGERVTQILREDLYKMSECDFSKLVHATNKYEKDGCGDDLTINPYREKGGPKEHVSVELNRRDKDGLPIVYAETIQSWGNWPGHKPQVIDTYRARPQEGWDPYEAPIQRAGYHDLGFRNPYQDRYERSYLDYRNYRPYQESQLQQTHHRGLRPEEFILPALLGIGLGAAFSLGRNNNHHHSFQPRPYFYPQQYNRAPNYYQQRRYC